MISNTVAVKLIQIGPFVFDAGTIIFPLCYILGDVLTEVYGYRSSRKVIWSAFGAIVLMSLTYFLVQYLPSASFWEGQGAYEQILGFVPRIVTGSIVAFFVGEFCNAYILSKLKVAMAGKHLWVRTLASSVVGQGLDTGVFVLVAFYGTLAGGELWLMFISGYLFKVAFEFVCTPATYAAVNFLKRKEGIDTFDRDINYNPFRLS